ncbi:ATP-binding protein [Streptomyces sp. NPDC001508]|uniref:ATP-binding protein n=1 Tax=Streptomyces sp. NPDC001508 TaxID=3154656 RepID=UPI0033260721
MTRDRSGTPPGGRSLGTRLLVVVIATLVSLTAALTVATVVVQHARLFGELDQRVTAAAERGVARAARHSEGDLSFLGDGGQPAGMLAARFDPNGKILSAAVLERTGGDAGGGGTGRAGVAGETGTTGQFGEAGSFTRADPSRARADGAAGGAGLGLAIAAAVVTAHGGRITVESAPGRTRFTARLPRKRTAGPTKVPVRAVQAPGGRAAGEKHLADA